MTPVSDDILLASLRWRYATKKFDPDRKIAAEHWRALEQSLIHAPSSFGLQPWRFFVVDDPEVRKSLVPVSWNQAQITDASHLVVFAVKKDFGPADVDRLLSRIVEVRGVTPDSLAFYKQRMLGAFDRPAEQVQAWATRQVYIALGFFLSAAAMLGIDACPMEGFQPEEYDRILGLPDRGYRSLVLATAGYRAADDPYLAQKKVRFRDDEVVIHLGG